MYEGIQEQRGSLEMDLIESFESGHGPSAFLEHALKALDRSEAHDLSAADRADYLRFAHRAGRLALGFIEEELAKSGAGPYDARRCTNPPT